MSYTNVDLVRHHFSSAWPSCDQVNDQPLVVDSDETISFFNGAVDDSTVRVKSLRPHTPERQTLILAASNLVSSVPLVPGSVVVASDSSLGTLFVENQDYVVNYPAGTLAVKSGGLLALGETVTVWLQSFTLYASGSDYQLDSATATIRRLSGGNIALGETVYLDYVPLYTGYGEVILANAVTEANGLVAGEVDPEGKFDADPTLQAAATYRALETLCLTVASRHLSARPDSDKAASTWMKLAELYAAKSRQLIREFRPPLNGPTNPMLS